MNKIALENLNAGSPESEWQVEGAGDATIQGFATNISTNVGGTVDFKIATDSTEYRIDIYRLGYYGGDGARKVASIEKTLDAPQIQPHPIVDAARGLIDAGNWAVSASWTIPEDLVSGVYVAKLVREDGSGGASHIPFIVRDDASTSDMVFQTSDTTWQAYNPWGGASLYGGETPLDPADMIGYLPPNCGCGVSAIGRAYAVSYNRPIVTNTSVPIYAAGPHSFVFGAEYSAIRWIEQNGYDVSYISGVDTTRAGAELLDHKAFLSVGHDEYWSAEQRANVEAARDAGVNLAFLGGNDVFWKVRWETSIDGSGTPYRTMVCYKESWAHAGIDPSDVATGTWRDPRFSDPGQEPENSLTGTAFTVNAFRFDTITIPYEFTQLRFWRNTEVAETAPGETASLVSGILGIEWNSDLDNGYRPAGLIDLSLSTISVDTLLQDWGSTYGPGEATHSLTMYRDQESGALVFSAGTIYWTWGLDSSHPYEEVPVDPSVKQAMVNLFADMGIQPTTLEASLALATGTTDFVAPTSSVLAPPGTGVYFEGQKVTVTGTASDLGGGRVAGVEVSFDNGLTWWKAEGRETWSYTWTAPAAGAYTIRSRAADDSLNLEAPATGTAVSVTLPSTNSFWTYAADPVVEWEMEINPIEVGVRFQATTDGTIDAIRFYKGAANISAHSVRLWTADGTLLASAASTGETLSGWQTVTLASPIAITAGTTYVASYHTRSYYAVDASYFTTPRTSGFLTAPVNAGVFAYGDAGSFPSQSYNAGNYWVDVAFSAAPNQVPTAVADTGYVANPDWPLVIAFSALLGNDTDPNGDPLTITAVSGASNGTVVLDAAAKTIRFSAAGGYSGPAGFSYTVSDGRGGTASATVGLTVEPVGAQGSLFTAADTPAITGVVDGHPVELGVRFTSAIVGTIIGLRYYKGTGETGTHLGSLWSASGSLLGSVTFTNETASGWQTATFASAVAITAGTTYVASYHSNGVYAASPGYFATPTTHGALTAPAGSNGVYAYGGTGVVPTSSYNSTNYWVDVVFAPSTANSAPVAVDDHFTATMSQPITLTFAQLLANDTDADGDTLDVTGVSDAAHGTVSLDTTARTVTFTPTSGYSGAAGFRYAIADGHGGSSSATVDLSVQPATQTIFSDADVPVLLTLNDNTPIALGLKFQADVAGEITGIRFYKSAANTGPHSAKLWTATGTLLASATFTGETASGWQTALLATPVDIDAGTTYVASYHSSGVYSGTGGYFTEDKVSGHLRALAGAANGGNGLYAYGSSDTFPSSSYNNANYYVDVVFRPELAA